MRKTTTASRSTMAENSSSRVYCLVAVASNIPSSSAGSNARSRRARNMSGMGASWMKRSRTVPRTMTAAS